MVMARLEWFELDKLQKWTYIYDVNNNLIEDLYQNWDGSNWVNVEKYSYAYDVNNNLIERLEQNWDGSNWVNYMCHIYI